ncbi:Uncharacterised protein [Bordetella ansorpii]|uniref:DUF4189 domain-containing protein n=1 Tax=Bordetella ansorpii TaxID=288768 RepID=A0A157SI63_9BORD|nr:Uncharacterised protein [Bordetella ansorpii]
MMMLARLLPLLRFGLAALVLVAGTGPVFAQGTGKAYAGAATDEKNTNVYWVTSQASSKQAEAAAVAQCKAKGGKGCVKLGWFTDSCLVYARNSRDTLFPGNSVSPEVAAKMAIRRCTADSADGGCRVTTLPVCVGPGYAAEHRAQSALRASAEAREALSARLDKRAYWGVIAENESGGLLYGDQYPSENEAVEQLLGWEDCKGCTKVLTYQNSCVGLAWQKGAKGRGTSFTALDPDPDTARNQSRAVCNAKTGGQSCVAMVRCSGRGYMQGYKGLDEKAN